MKSLKISLMVIVAMLTLASCSDDSNRIYEEIKDLNQSGWKRGNPVEFEFEIKDSSKYYDIFYDIRNDRDYKYYNLYLKYVLMDTLHNLIVDTEHNMNLFHPKTGEPQFVSGGSAGDLLEHRYRCFYKYKFPKQGPYLLRVKQNMRDESVLKGILAIGIRIEEHREE